ncbi:MAG: prepilin-type N-terminal cleavage/methylation domain-containing protein [Nitrospinota bacterium]
MRPAISKEDGFTLVETLLTLFLAGLLAAALLNLAHHGQRAASAALRLTEAAAVSNSLMSVLLSRADDEPSGTVDQGGREYLWKADVRKLPGEELESVDLTVEWLETSGPRSLAVSILRAVQETGESEPSSPAQ